ncbi:hypothetical protein GN958_ATG23488 [Phytophthora infestans]|uniref:Uncharacterized protein n=1 Tax=Phytophthora infestans TaxID=4787 RepID=A0A8S9TKU6_PHYIN|nr:hypothetical protein GN958_ATG23488 [Phytophthora infestans]
MEKYHMDVLHKDKQAKAEKKALLTKRQLQNAFDESLDLAKRRHHETIVHIEDPDLLEFIRYITYDLGGIIIDMPGATRLRADIKPLSLSEEPTIRNVSLWTSGKAQSSMALTVHFVDDDAMLCNRTLEVESFPGMYTGVAIATGLEIMRER